MKVCSIFLLTITLVSLSTSNGQCTLCADGTTPPNGNATLPVPGLGEFPCSEVAQLIAAVSATQCTQAQAAGYLICGCPTAPEPNLGLPCAFCADGTPPTNLDVIVTLPDSSEATCQDLMALASTLDDSAVEQCQAVAAASDACGCLGAVETESASPSEFESTMPSFAPSLAPSASMMPSSAETSSDTEMPTPFATEMPSPVVLPSSIEPTAELTTSNAHRIVGARAVVGSALIGMVAALV